MMRSGGGADGSIMAFSEIETNFRAYFLTIVRLHMCSLAAQMPTMV